MYGLIIRLVLIVGGYMLFQDGCRDYNFNKISKNPKEYTLTELEKANPSEIPTYIKVKDIEFMSGVYIEKTNKKYNSLQSITYPVFSLSSQLGNMIKLDSSDKDHIKTTLDENAQKIVKIIVTDSDVKREAVENGSYFTNFGNVIEGRYDKDGLSTDDVKLFEQNGYSISKDAFKLIRGSKPFGFWGSIFAMIGGVALIILGIALFLTYFSKSE